MRSTVELLETNDDKRTSMGGRVIEITARRKIFAEKRTASQKEFYQAQQSGFEVTKVFIIWRTYYSDERTLFYKNKYYTIIYAAEIDSRRIKLTCTKKEGTFVEASR